MTPDRSGDEQSTARPEYAERLSRLQGTWWKRLVDVQAPYRWNLQRMRLGRTLDVGCGVGRNLENLRGTAVGIDHNPDSIAACRSRGFTAYTVDEFESSGDAVDATFDALLFAHVLEHMRRDDAVTMVQGYVRYLRPAGKVVMITPQERGYASDATHVEFLDLSALGVIATTCELRVDRSSSFPFPRWAGRWFTYNEFVVVAAR